MVRLFWADILLLIVDICLGFESGFILRGVLAEGWVCFGLCVYFGVGFGLVIIACCLLVLMFLGWVFDVVF